MSRSGTSRKGRAREMMRPALLLRAAPRARDDSFENQARHRLRDPFGPKPALAPIPLRDRISHPEDKPRQQRGVGVGANLPRGGRLFNQGRDFAIEAPPP